jgi:hypothetical protein
MCLYRSGVQWVILNGRANREEGAMTGDRGDPIATPSVCL